MRRAVVYLRVSTVDQTTANQECELREIAGWHLCCPALFGPARHRTFVRQQLSRSV